MAKPVCYAKDAMTGLQPDEPHHGPGRARGGAGRASRHRGVLRSRRAAAKPPRPFPHGAAPRCAPIFRFPPRRISSASVRDVPHLPEVWSYINPFMLYGRHLGYKGNFEKALAEHDAKALELFHNLEDVKQEAARFMKVRAVWQFFEAERDGQRHPPVRARAARRRCTRSALAASRARTACA